MGLKQDVASRLRIVVLGYIVRGPLGGMVWHHLQYVLGLARLGHDVYFLEDSDDYPSCYDPSRHVTGEDPAYGIQFIAATFDRFGISDRWAYYDAHQDHWHGPLSERVKSICAEADVVVNLSGVNPLRAWLRDVPVRIFVDTDPAFTQIRHLQNPQAKRRAELHTAFFTFAENIANGDCQVPDDGFAWKPTRQPICLECWPVVRTPSKAHFTTVMQWDSFPPLLHDGIQYGMKSASFEPLLGIPERTSSTLELALGSPNAPRDQLAKVGWRLSDPLEATRDAHTFQRYVQQSKAEFSVAKHGYVISRSGWFSERSAAYLASGRPVVVQHTGFRNWLAADRGAVAFETPDQAIAGIEAVNENYDLHCVAAREVCAAYFDYRRILVQMIDEAFETEKVSPA